MNKSPRKIKGNFFYRRVETDSYVKTYICGIRTRKRSVNPCKFIDIKMTEQENHLKTWLTDTVNTLYSEIDTKILKLLNEKELSTETQNYSDNVNILDNIYKDNQNIKKEIKDIKYALGVLMWRANNVQIMSQSETIDKIIKEHCSISRFGDGEISWMCKEGAGWGFQKSNPLLTKRLNEIFTSPHKEKIIICLSGSYKPESPKCDYWKKHAEEIFLDLNKHIVANRKFGETGITRNANNVPHMKQIWQDKDIVIVEGELSRLGVGNDLFDNVKSLKRILCPAKNAFDKYDEIFAECLKQPKEKLFLLALGPTATVLAYDLCNKGYQALDVGHIDICYEWKLRGAIGKIAIPGKYVNEVPDGRDNIEDCTDENYLNSIIAKIL